MINLNQSEKILYRILKHHLMNNPQEYIVSYFGPLAYSDLVTLSRTARPLPTMAPVYIREMLDRSPHDIVMYYVENRVNSFRLPGVSDVIVNCGGMLMYPGSIFAPLGCRVYTVAEMSRSLPIPSYLLVSLTKNQKRWNRLFRVARSTHNDTFITLEMNELFKVAVADAMKTIEYNRALLGQGPNRPR